MADLVQVVVVVFVDMQETRRARMLINADVASHKVIAVLDTKSGVRRDLATLATTAQNCHQSGGQRQWVH